MSEHKILCTLNFLGSVKQKTVDKIFFNFENWNLLACTESPGVCSVSAAHALATATA